MSQVSRKVRRSAQSGDGYFAQEDIRLLNQAADEIEQLEKSLSDTLNALDHAIYLVGPDANQIKGMVGAAERARELIK